MPSTTENQTGKIDKSGLLAPWTMQNGASWVKPDGTTYKVEGFHMAWLRDNPELVEQLSTTVDVIQKLRWLSLVMYTEGYVELCVDDLASEGTVEAISSLLAKNEPVWQKVLLMSMSEEGYLQFTKEEYQQYKRDISTLVKVKRSN